MAMEINGLNNQNNTNKTRSSQGTATPKNKDSANSEATPQNTGSDSVKLSPEALKLNEVSNKLDTDAPFDQSKVETLRAAISEGRYKPNPGAIAEKLIDSDLQFK